MILDFSQQIHDAYWVPGRIVGGKDLQPDMRMNVNSNKKPQKWMQNICDLQTDDSLTT